MDLLKCVWVYSAFVLLASVHVDSVGDDRGGERE